MFKEIDLGGSTMEESAFEAAFAAFLERHEYDAAEEALFQVVRSAFLAGWNAAHGIMPQEEPPIGFASKEDPSGE